VSSLLAQLQKTLGDAYHLERELGGDGMSRVLVANERRLDRKVVVKVLSLDLAKSLTPALRARARGRFSREG
jgi:hypothetical protein